VTAAGTPGFGASGPRVIRLTGEAPPRLWPLAMLGGVGLFAIGVILIAWPGATGVVLAILAGLAMLWRGMLAMIESLLERPAPGWGLELLGGLLGIVVGGVVLAWPHQTVLVVAVLLGIYLLVEGLTRMMGELISPTRHRGLGIVVSVVAIIAGIVVIADPSRSLHVVSKVLGVVLVCVGIVQAFGAFALRHVETRDGWD
jgi:uncharacterized membrane protein HdeD (DUF308 family)